MRTFRAEVEDFLSRHPEISPSAFGRQALNDFSFVRDLRSGRNPRIDTVERVRKWMCRLDKVATTPKRGGRRRRAAANVQPALA